MRISAVPFNMEGLVYMGRCKQKILMSDSGLLSKENESGNAAVPGTAGIVQANGTYVNPRHFLNYEDVEKRVVYKLVNTGRNRELLEDVPHIEFLDLSIVFQIVLTGEPEGTASLLIHSAHIKLWGVTVDNLFKAAAKNTPKIMGCELKSMDDVICEILQGESAESFDRDAAKAELADSVPLYVLSNRYKVEGAACVLYPMLLQEICVKLNSSFYIIPSSIHEVLIMPTDGYDTGEELRAMIKDVNDTQVDPDEILSYSLYYYDGDENRLSVV